MAKTVFQFPFCKRPHREFFTTSSLISGKSSKPKCTLKTPPVSGLLLWSSFIEADVATDRWSYFVLILSVVESQNVIRVPIFGLRRFLSHTEIIAHSTMKNTLDILMGIKIT